MYGYLLYRLDCIVKPVLPTFPWDFSMRLEPTGRKELVRWILSWMPDAKVLAPESLRDRIAEKLRDGLRQQQEG